MADNDTTCKYHAAIKKEIESIRREIKLQFDMLGKAIDAAKKELDRRLESMNEFRSQLDRQAKEFMPGREIKLLFEQQRKDIDRNRIDLAEKTGGKKWSDHIITVIIGFFILLIVYILMKTGG